MIVCTVCHAHNHHLAVVCSGCGGYLQTKVGNLDLFATAWRLIESPTKGFQLVSVAQHKNYCIFLSAIAGVAFIFLYFWAMKAGETASLFGLVSSGFSIGPVIGIVTVLLFSLLIKILAKITKLKASFKNIFAVTSYALIPVIISVIFVLPIELLTFGVYFFTLNPSPMTLKPASYVALLGLDAMFGFWTIALLFKGMKVLLDVPMMRAIVYVVVSMVLMGSMTAWVLHLLTTWR